MSEKQTGKKGPDTTTEPTKKARKVNAYTGAEKPATATTKPETVVYIGPNILSEGLKKNTVYRGRPTELIEAIAEKHPGIIRLFVKVDKLSRQWPRLIKRGHR
jgi:hypothetical protein